MMKLNVLIGLLLCLCLLGCQADRPSGGQGNTRQKEEGVRADLQEWINKEFSGRDKLKLAVEDLARTAPESCDFKLKVECIEQIVGFDKALEIELEMMKRVLNTPERQKRFDKNIQKCHFGQGMNKQVCAHETAED